VCDAESLKRIPFEQGKRFRKLDNQAGRDPPIGTCNAIACGITRDHARGHGTGISGEMHKRPLAGEICHFDIIGDEVASEPCFERLRIHIGRRDPQRVGGRLHQPHTKLQSAFRIGDA
jgi:hypothetical protein